MTLVRFECLQEAWNRQPPPSFFLAGYFKYKPKTNTRRITKPSGSEDSKVLKGAEMVKFFKQFGAKGLMPK